MNSLRKELLALLVIGILAFVAYSNSFHGEFQYDDDRLIRFNFALREVSNWQTIARFEPFRPLTLLSYALNYRIGQKDPFSYHVFDFGFHLLSTVLFYAFTRRLAVSRLISFFAAALFALHPLNTESVSYTASRPILLCTIFFWSALLTFDSHLRKPFWFKPVLFFLFLLLGLLSKEEAALIPAAALLYNYAYFGSISIKKYWLIHGISFALIGLGVIYRLSFLSGNIPYPFSIYVPTEMYVWLRYLGLAIYPISLNVDHYVESLHLTHWKFLLSFLAVAFLLYLLWRSRKQYSWIFFWGTWFFLNLTASSFVPLNDFMAEHRTYLSMFGFCACVAYLISFSKAQHKLIPIVLSFLLLFYLAATWKRNLLWQKPITLWADSVQKSPNKYRPHINVAYSLYQLRQYDAALREYLIARDLNPSNPYVHCGIGFTLVELKMLEPAEKSFLQTLRLDSGFIDAKTGLGILKYRDKRYEEAISFFVQVYPHRRESVELIRMMCESYLHLGRTQDALQILSDASRWNRRFLTVSRLLEKGNRPDAVLELERIRPPS